MFECLLRGDSGGEEAKEKEETDNSEETSKREETNESEETKAEETSEGPLNFANAQGNNIEETNAKKQNIMETNVKKTNFKKTDVQLSEGGIERLAYPLLLEATNAERLFLSFTKISDAFVITYELRNLVAFAVVFLFCCSVFVGLLLLFLAWCVCLFVCLFVCSLIHSLFCLLFICFSLFLTASPLWICSFSFSPSCCCCLCSL